MANLRNKMYNGCETHPNKFGPAVIPENIPDHLKNNGKWCVWLASVRVAKDDSTKMDKIPCTANGRLSTGKPALWMTFNDAYELYSTSKNNSGYHLYNGIGILVEKGNIFVDIDGELDQKVFKNVHTYKELSPSGNGLRIIGTGELQTDITKPIEIYGGNAPRFVTITGSAIDGCESNGLADIQDLSHKYIADNHSSIVSGKAKDAATSKVPKRIRFDFQEWWPHVELTFAGGDDRSSVLFGWSIALLQGNGTNRGLTPQQLLSVYCDNDEIAEMANSHWKGKSTAYLWSDICKAEMFIANNLKLLLAEFAERPDFDDFAEPSASESSEKDKKLSHDKSPGESKNEQSIKQLKHENNSLEAVCAAHGVNTDESINKKLGREKSRILSEVIQDHQSETTPIQPDKARLSVIYDKSVYMSKSSKFSYLNDDGALVTLSKSDFINFMNFPKIMGKFNGGGKPAKFNKIAGLNFVGGIEGYRQCSAINRHVDMFCTEPRTIYDPREQVLTVITPHTRFAGGKALDKFTIDEVGIMTQYFAHFPYLDDFIQFVVNARFASTRKQCSLWFHAPSDWGKNVLVDTFSNLGIVLETSEDELEKLMTGAPVGMDLSRISNPWILLVDEFKKVKGELKKMDNSITGSSKNQSETTVNIHAKVFMSADHNEGLVGTNGVNAQFANRMNYFNGLEGCITSLPCWTDEKASNVVRVIRSYIIGVLNDKVDAMIKLGRFGSSNVADRNVRQFHKKYGIANVGAFQNTTDVFQEIADDFVKLVNKTFEYGIDVDLPPKKREVQQWIKDNVFHVSKFVNGCTKEYLFLTKPLIPLGMFLMAEGGIGLTKSKREIVQLCSPNEVFDRGTVKTKAYSQWKMRVISGVEKSKNLVRKRGVYIEKLSVGIDDF